MTCKDAFSPDTSYYVEISGAGSMFARSSYGGDYRVNGWSPALVSRHQVSADATCRFDQTDMIEMSHHSHDDI